MTPEQLTTLLDGLATAADVVEAIDDGALQQRHGWDLAGWHYDLVPWGVRFTRQDASGQEAAVVAVLAHQAAEPSHAARTVVLVG
jgi:hypothetical protein